MPRYASGVQYAFCLPSSLQNTSRLRRPLDVVADEQIEPAVAVVIEPERRRAEPLALAEPRLVVTSVNVPLPVLWNRRF